MLQKKVLWMRVQICAERHHVYLFAVVSLTSLSLAEILFPLWAVQGHQLVCRWAVYPMIKKDVLKTIHKAKKKKQICFS